MSNAPSENTLSRIMNLRIMMGEQFFDPLLNSDALVFALLNEALVTGQSTLLVVNQIVPETSCQPLFCGSHLFAQTGVHPKDVVSWIKAKVAVSEIQKEELQGNTHQPPVQAQCIAKQHMAQTFFFGLGLARGDS